MPDRAMLKETAAAARVGLVVTGRQTGAHHHVLGVKGGHAVSSAPERTGSGRCPCNWPPPRTTPARPPPASGGTVFGEACHNPTAAEQRAGPTACTETSPAHRWCAAGGPSAAFGVKQRAHPRHAAAGINHPKGTIGKVARTTGHPWLGLALAWLSRRYQHQPRWGAGRSCLARSCARCRRLLERSPCYPNGPAGAACGLHARTPSLDHRSAPTRPATLGVRLALSAVVDRRRTAWRRAWREHLPAPPSPAAASQRRHHRPLHPALHRCRQSPHPRRRYRPVRQSIRRVSRRSASVAGGLLHHLARRCARSAGCQNRRTWRARSRRPAG